jgi:tungstate transport system ATP-binding protein
MFNLFSGKILRKKEGPCLETGAIRIWVPPDTPPADTAHVTINPDDIIVSREPFTSSARNQFQGMVTEIRAQGGDVLLKIRSQEVFSVRITEPSLREMRLSVGSQVFLTFKAMSVQVL